ncbi:10515_t:CDS:2 [Diversispora eburnea]|uniref:dolichyl-phosphate beta-glucosyltransferase n=1 Tax=Diversispora eburnea TaxID=1213867 RepID=A0A9N9BGB6_9GLOM|nr:10515_t:CDS:2 [Diversispora eburnea]
MELLTFIGLFTIFGISVFFAFLIVFSPKSRKRTESEKYYLASKTNKPQPLPSIFDESVLYLTVVVPAHNETMRIPLMLQETVSYLEGRKLEDKNFQYEIIVVDDGSTDNTTMIVLEFGNKNKNVDLKVLKLEKNRKKGGAVAQVSQQGVNVDIGILSSSGKHILFADADGATQFSDFEFLERELKRIVDKDGFGVAVGSRAHLVKTEAVVKVTYLYPLRSFIRNFLMHSFHKVLFIFGIRDIADTQCGFKLFTRKSGLYIFSNMHVEGWIFDIEMLLIAQFLKMPIVEVPVTWHEIDGSKVSLIKDSIQMAMDLLIIRLNYFFGFWKIHDPLSRPKRE